MNFKDPTLPERQLGLIIFATVLTALMQMKKAGRTNVSPAQVESFMLERAKHSPQDMALLNLLQYFELVLLLRKAERRNKVYLYFACMRFSLPLLAVANAGNYVHIFCDMLQYWETCSDAEHALVREYGFTLTTPNGVKIQQRKN